MIRFLQILCFLILISSGNLLLAQQNSIPNEFPTSNTADSTSGINNRQVEVVWFSPNETPGEVGKHKKMEFGFRLSPHVTQQINYFLSRGVGGINPFDPDAIDFRVHLTAPDGTKNTRYAFYYAPFIERVSGSAIDPGSIQNEFVQDTSSFAWRFRFSPPTVGEWSATIEILMADGSTIVQSGITFMCVPSDHKGILKVSQTGTEKDRWMYYSETGEPFYAISENIASAGECAFKPSQKNRQLDAVQKLIDVGGNFTRFEIGGQSALPDWPVYNNYKGKLDEMYAFDELVDLCESNDVYFTLFRHHVEVMDRADWADIRWALNPYHTGLNCTIEGYFSDAEVIKWQKKCLRYIFSRWGYSPNMTFYSYSEVDNWYTKLLEVDSNEKSSKKGNKEIQTNAVLLLRKWISDQQDYIKSDLSNTILFCHSPARLSDLEKNPETSFFTLSDVVGLHMYAEKKETNFKQRYDHTQEYWERYKKPVMIEEMGPNKVAMFCCTGIEFHNSIWSTAMMGSFGTGMDWWWDRGVFDLNYQVDFKHIEVFFEGENLREGNFTPQKWKDASFKKMKIENYALVQENQERVLGWVHNATFYWRNMSETNPCLNNLINETTVNNPPCYFGVDPHGYPFSQIGSACPVEHIDVYKHEDLKGFDNPNFKDAYTDKGVAQTIQSEEGNRKNPTFKISGLKSSGFSKKHWYKIQFYYTEGSVFGVALNETQVLHTNRRGNLESHVPNLNFTHADYGYKVVYLGYY